VSLHASVIEAELNTYMGALKFMVRLCVAGLPFLVLVLMLILPFNLNISENVKFFTTIVIAICLTLILGAVNVAIPQI